MRTTKGLGDNTAKRKFGRMREVFAEAIENGKVASNPFKVKGIKVAVGAASETYIDEATIKEVLSTAQRPNGNYCLRSLAT